MIYQILIPQSVYEELNQIALYYESNQKSLGLKFLLDWELSSIILKKSPFLFQKKHKQLRSVNLKRFPYTIVYEVEENIVYIYRVIHNRKKPKKVFKK